MTKSLSRHKHQLCCSRSRVPVVETLEKRLLLATLIEVNSFSQQEEAVPMQVGRIWPEGEEVPSVPTVSWIGNGDATSWNDPNNWSGGIVPGPSDDVAVNSNLPTILSFADDITVRSLATTAGVTVQAVPGITLTLTAGTSTFGGAVDFEGSRLVADGSDVSVVFETETLAADWVLNAKNGGRISLPSLTEFSSTETAPFASLSVIEASGPGSVIEFPELIHFPVARRIYVSAQSGGAVRMPKLDAISRGDITIRANGHNSFIDLSALMTWTTQSRSHASADFGATINLSSLQEANRIGFAVDEDSHLPLEQIEAVNNGSLSITGKVFVFEHLREFDGSSITASGEAQALFPNLTSLESGDRELRVSATGNASIDLSAVTRLAGHLTVVAGKQSRRGIVDLRNLSNLGGSPIHASTNEGVIHLSSISSLPPNSTLTATNQGRIDIPNAITEVTGVQVTIGGGSNIPVQHWERFENGTIVLRDDSYEFTDLQNVNGSTIRVHDGALNLPALVHVESSRFYAEGSATTVLLRGLRSTDDSTYLTAVMGALIDASGLSGDMVLADVRAEGPDALINLGAIEFLTSALTVTDGGEIAIPDVIRMRGDVSIGRTGILQTQRWREFRGYLTTWQALTLPNLVSVDHAQFVANNTELILPSVTRITTIGRFIGKTFLFVAGADGRISFPNLVEIQSLGLASIEAYAGGVVDLPKLTRTEGAGVAIRANDLGSLVSLPLLTDMLGQSGGLRVSDEGSIDAPNLQRLENVSVFLDDRTGRLDTSSWKHMSGGALTVRAREVAFEGLEQIDGVFISLADPQRIDSTASLQMNSLISADNLTVHAWNGSTVLLSTESTVGFEGIHITGEGARLSLPETTSLDLTKASIVISNGASFIAPVLESMRGHDHAQLSISSGASVEFPQLRVIDAPPDDGFEVLVSDNALFRVGDNVESAKWILSVDSTSQVLGGQVQTSHHERFVNVPRIDFAGEMSVDLVNQSLLRIEDSKLRINGDYLQTKDGITRITIGNDSLGTDSYPINIDGVATLGGTLDLRFANGFTPNSITDYLILSAEKLVGTFDDVTMRNVPDGFQVHYGLNSIILTNDFSRPPLETLAFNHVAGDDPVFFDVRSGSGGPTGIQVIARDGQLVFASNASPIDPNDGDFGPIRLPGNGNYEVRMFGRPNEVPTYDWDFNVTSVDSFPAILGNMVAGRIDEPGNVSRFSIEITSRSDLELISETLSEELALRFTLTSPSGTNVASWVQRNESNLEQGRRTLRIYETGTYEMRVDGVGDDIGDFQFAVQQSAPPNITDSWLTLSPDSQVVNGFILKFNRPMETSEGNFSIEEDLLQLIGDSQSLEATNTQWLDPTMLHVEFAERPIDAVVVLAIRPSILSDNGQPIDQDRDGLGGELTEDIYTATLAADTKGPHIFQTTPRSVADAPLSQVQFHFNEPIEPLSVSTQSVVAFTGPHGDLRESITGVIARGADVTIYFEEAVSPGRYTIEIDSTVTDVTGNQIDQNQDGIEGEETDRFTMSFDLLSTNLVVDVVTHDESREDQNQITTRWTVRNTELQSAVGQWWDYVYLSTDQRWDLDDVLLGRVLHDTDSEGELNGTGGSYEGTFIADISGLASGEYYVIVRTNLLETLAEITFSDNVLPSQTPLTIASNALSVGDNVSDVLGINDAILKRIEIPASAPSDVILLQADVEGSNVPIEMYLRRGSAPTRHVYDFRSEQGVAPGQHLVVTDVQPGTWYVLVTVSPDNGQFDDTTTVITRVEYVLPTEFSVLSSSFGSGGTAGNRTIEIEGANFDQSTTVQLQMSDQESLDPEHYDRPTDRRLYATFDLSNATPGDYDVVISNQFGQTETIESGFSVVEGGGGDLFIETSAPPAFRRPFHPPYVHYPVTVTWKNRGLNDVDVPLLRLVSSEPFTRDLQRDLVGDGEGQTFNGKTIDFLVGRVPGGPSKVVIPGQSVTDVIYVVPRLAAENPSGPAIFLADPALHSNDDFDWQAMKSLLRESTNLPDDRFDSLFDEFRSTVGESEADVGQLVRNQLTVVDDYSDLSDLIRKSIEYQFTQYLGKVLPSLRGTLHSKASVFSFSENRVIARNVDSLETFYVDASASGEFVFTDLPYGKYQFRLEGHLSITGNIAELDFQSGQQHLSLIVEPAGSIAGSVIDESGNPIRDAIISAFSADGGFTAETTASEIRAEFALHSLSPGRYELVISAPGFQSVSRTETIPAGITDLDVTLSDGQLLRGFLLSDSDHNPVVGASITLAALDGSVLLTTQSNHAGFYQFRELTMGDWQLTVSHPDHVPVVSIVSIDQVSTSLDLTLGSGAAVSGTLTQGYTVDRRVSGLLLVSESNSYRAELSSSGEYVFSGVAPGSHALIATFEDYSFEIGKVNSVLKGELREDVDFSIPELIDASGVITGGGEPLSDVLVTLEFGRSTLPYVTTTDDVGRFTFSEIPAGDFVFRLQKDGYVEGRAYRTIFENASIDLELGASGTINGLAQGIAGAPDLSAILARLTDLETRQSVIALINDSGEFGFVDVRPGMYSLDVSSTQHVYASKTLEINGGISDHLFQPVAGSISGQVVDTGGIPIAGASVTLTVKGQATLPDSEVLATTSIDGSFSFVGVPTDNVTISASANGFAQHSQHVTSVESEVELRLAAGVSVTGLVTEAGEPSVGARVALHAITDHPEPVLVLQTDENGEWSIPNVQTGQHRLTIVSAEGLVNQQVVDIQADQHIEIRLMKAMSQISGMITDADSGIVIPGVTVVLQFEGQLIAETESDNRGRFQFNQLADGEYTIRPETELGGTEEHITLFGSAEVGIPILSSAIARPDFQDSQIERATARKRIAEGEDSSDAVQNPALEYVSGILEDAKGERTQLHNRIADLVDDTDAIRMRQNAIATEIEKLTIYELPTLPREPQSTCGCFSSYEELVFLHESTSEARSILRTTLADLRVGQSHIEQSIENSLEKADANIRVAVTASEHLSQAISELIGFLANFNVLWGIVIDAIVSATISAIFDSNSRLNIAEFFIQRAKTPLAELRANFSQQRARVEEYNAQVDNFQRRLRKFEQKQATPNFLQAPTRGFFLTQGETLDIDLFAPLRNALQGVNYRIEFLSQDRQIHMNADGTLRLSGEDCGYFELRYRLIINCEDGISEFFSNEVSTTGTVGLNVRPERMAGGEICGQRSGRSPDGDPCFEIPPSITDDCGSFDPNDILGPRGVGDQHFVGPNIAMNYTIRFENDPEKGTAPAAVVRVDQQIDEDLALNTLRFRTFGFGDEVFDLGAGQGSFAFRIDRRDQLGILIDVSAGIDVSTGKLSFELRSIDPNTGQIPFNPFLGLLPPNKVKGEGEGFLTYSIDQKGDLPTDTRIDAEAEIFFDQNEAILTPAIFNTVDADAPFSSIDSLPETSDTTFTVSLNGSDGEGRSGIGRYDVYVSKDSAPFELLFDNLSETSLEFTGINRSVYRFYSVATDNVGNRESVQKNFEAETTIVSAGWVNAVSSLSENSMWELILDIGASNSQRTLTFTSDDDRLIFPGEYVIESGESRVTIPVAVLDDMSLTGDRHATFAAHLSHDILLDATISIEDDEAHAPFRNPVNHYDVNGLGDVTALDALLVISLLNRHRSNAVDLNWDGENRPESYYDVSGDGKATPLDALHVINEINRQSNSQLSLDGDEVIGSLQLSESSTLDEDETRDDLFSRDLLFTVGKLF